MLLGCVTAIGLCGCALTDKSNQTFAPSADTTNPAVLDTIVSASVETSVSTSSVSASSASTSSVSAMAEAAEINIPAAATPNAAESLEAQLNACIAALSLEEKAGQLFNIRLNENDLPMIERLHLGGVTLFKENIESEAQVKKLTADLQAMRAIPLLIGIDEEGGQVSRLKELYGNSYESAYQTGQTHDPQNAFDVALEIGRTLKSLGVNMDFAPVADIWSNPQNRVIGDRAYGKAPEEVSPMVAAAVRGFHEAGVLSVIKHFPGHGDTLEDSHQVTAVYSHDLERLRSFEILPFQAGVDAGADGVMAGHIAAPKITGNNVPAGFQPFFLQDMLRDQMGFDGLIVTDALEMGGVSHAYSAAQAALEAFQAGADILLLPSDPEQAYQAILAACRDNRISEERLNASVRRILQAKTRLGWRPFA
jgi:beta-N-acetylhexosaminidase